MHYDRFRPFDAESVGKSWGRMSLRSRESGSSDRGLFPDIHIDFGME
jgi:hypothetical protein